MWDFENTFSDRQTLTDGPSENVVDAGPDDIGLGEPVYLQVSLSAGATSAAGMTVTVESADAADMANAVDRVIFLVDAAAVAKGGVVLAAPLPTGCGRYLRLQYVGASGAKVTAGLVQGAQTAGMR